MPSASMVLGGLTLTAQWPVTITPPERTLTVSGNALSANPVHVNDYVSDFGTIAFSVVMKGTASVGETAVENVEVQIAALKAQVAQDTNTLYVQWGESSAVTAYMIYKSKPPTVTYEAALRSAVAFVEVTLNYLPSA
jgi:hypothetical protein